MTLEAWVPDNSKKVKIPNVCDEFGDPMDQYLPDAQGVGRLIELIGLTP